MLTKVVIENFQSHKLTTVEFVPGTNVIIGESDAGKSAVFRAINWVVSNRPLGDAYRSEWGGDTEISLYTSDGHLIERIRSATRNEYIVDGQVLKAFGTEVPDEVLEILRLDIASIQAQMDSPFLLAASPGEAARLLNKAASIDEIDIVTSNLRKSHSEIGRRVKYNEGRLTESQQQMEQYVNIPMLEERLGRVEEMERERASRITNLHLLTRLISKVRELNSRLEKTSYLPALVDRLDSLIILCTSYQSRATKYTACVQMSNRAGRLFQALEDSEGVDRGIVELRVTEQEFASWRDRNVKAESNRQLVSRARRLMMSIDEVQEALDKAEEQFHALAPEMCPLCGNRMGGVVR